MRLVLRFQIEGEEYLGRVLDRAVGAVSDLSVAWREVLRNVIYPSILANFAAQGRPIGWAALEENYAKRKLRKVGPKPILQLYGGLIDAMVVEGTQGGKYEIINPTSVEIGIERAGPIFYGIFHTSSRPRKRVPPPQRQFLLLQEDDIEPIVDIVQRQIIEQIQGGI